MRDRDDVESIDNGQIQPGREPEDGWFDGWLDEFRRAAAHAFGDWDFDTAVRPRVLAHLDPWSSTPERPQKSALSRSRRKWRLLGVFYALTAAAVLLFLAYRVTPILTFGKPAGDHLLGLLPYEVTIDGREEELEWVEDWQRLNGYFRDGRIEDIDGNGLGDLVLVASREGKEFLETWSSESGTFVQRFVSLHDPLVGGFLLEDMDGDRNFEMIAAGRDYSADHETREIRESLTVVLSDLKRRLEEEQAINDREAVITTRHRITEVQRNLLELDLRSQEGRNGKDATILSLWNAGDRPSRIVWKVLVDGLVSRLAAADITGDGNKELVTFGYLPDRYGGASFIQIWSSDGAGNRFPAEPEAYVPLFLDRPFQPPEGEPVFLTLSGHPGSALFLANSTEGLAAYRWRDGSLTEIFRDPSLRGQLAKIRSGSWELLALLDGSTLRLLRATEQGVFELWQGWPEGVAPPQGIAGSADIDGDSLDDLLFSTKEDGRYLVMFARDREPEVTELWVPGKLVSAGDMDGDGITEILVIDANGSARVGHVQ